MPGLLDRTGQDLLMRDVPAWLGQAWDYLRAHPAEAVAAVTPGGGVQDMLRGGGEVSQGLLRGDAAGLLGGAATLGGGLMGLLPIGGMVGRAAERAAPEVGAGLQALQKWAKETYPGVKLWAAQDGNTGAIRVSQIVVPEEQRGAGVGTEIMRRITALADEAQLPVALSPDGAWGGSVPRLKRFYARLGFQPNKGRSRDLSISETMIRPPEARQASAAAEAVTPAAEALPRDPAARAARATEQGYTVDAYKAMQPYTGGPVTDWRGRVVDEGPPQALVEEFNSPGSPYAGFFAADPAVANRFAQAFGPGSAVYPAKLRLQNPLVIEAGGKPAGAFQFQALAREHGTAEDVKRYAGAFAEGSPYDGVILRNTGDEGTVYVPRTPQQARSRFANFDPAQMGSGNMLAGGLLGAALLPGALQQAGLLPLPADPQSQAMGAR